MGFPGSSDSKASAFNVREAPLEVLVKRWLTFSMKDRESALISRRYGVPGFFIPLLY